ncbi:hypothetical protein EWP20_09625 [Neisseria meningitidis]|uniref:Uncharacterized protein n=1 Tax=Neisseria meningitidis serogroup B (strain ATCC BAA-335 / MC58) TaxID=122586 RepID=Q9JYG1_NEIMB|nr:hypothetical protein NMB1600 [Neisseria meningitidis MC58]ARC07332.1 hypothetical protein A6J49_03520 [Neisseria meningitidis]MBW5388558.1 hypothetical protein [Salmonella enterica subsp. enterica serovar Minnesota]MBG8578027.1 hypothetical protein [Neisseria meningitidis]MBG8594359.1 hypothetical protein [Neisseria meningitidis]
MSGINARPTNSIFSNLCQIFSSLQGCLKTQTPFSDGLFSLKSPYRSIRKHRRIIMEVTISAIINGEFADQYGKRGSQFNENGMLI